MIDKRQLAALLLAFLSAFYTRHRWYTRKAVFDTERNGMEFKATAVGYTQGGWHPDSSHDSDKY